ncbi:pseudouridylate synthase RPUSD2-like [Argiope bruennichi]|uniref:Pseudouridine synthase n=1 Tax=Argiope bruennichi TaxID=94029 RepID=A0A8T0EDZ6_ARGBR|nr:pseudouridylate synthase RPUSD2-like [Argiope bruennichi]KAF8771019.1 RNA pseudouridylate synthase like protein [Argiope bruennichi]
MISGLRFRSKTFCRLFYRSNKILTSNTYNSDPNDNHCNKHVENLMKSTTFDEIQNHSQRKENPYYIEDRLRKVYPYYFNHLTYCKKRWAKRTLIDIYSCEFGLYPRNELERRILSGAVKVNGEPVDLEYELKLSDVLSSKVHRHELPVLAASIKVIYEDENFVVIDKPPSIPVHPCGLYRYNSAVFILEQEGNWRDLHVIHRLDRLTSGVLIFAKNVESSRKIHEDLNMRDVTKEYICRVEGEFPDGVIMCNKPLKHFYNKIGIALVHPRGKISVTEFQKLSFNGKSSVVKCKLYTGRTHQIRAHLQYLGFPILNDSLYNSYIFGPEKGKHGKIHKSIDKLLKDLVEIHSTEWFVKDDEKKTPCNSETDTNISKLLLDMNCYNMDAMLHSDAYKKNSSRLYRDEDCFFCNNVLCDPKPSNLFMFLHAHIYKSDKWEFQTDMPIWASDDWNIM